MPATWREGLPDVDKLWIAKSLFGPGSKSKGTLQDFKVDRLWYYPPPPSRSCPGRPSVERYFAHRLFLWMPRRLWSYKFHCPNDGCQGNELTSAGVYKTIKQILDVESYYLMATEYLECRKCGGKLAAWSPAVVSQLDFGHRQQFPAVLTYKYSCDLKVK